MTANVPVLPVAVDAMGGDRAPEEIVAGARAAAAEGLPVVLVGPPRRLRALDVGDLEIIAASEVIAMDEDPARGVRTKKDSSLVRAAEAVRDGQATAMVSAGNTGAAMASALLRMGRLRAVQRPAIAIPIPGAGETPTVLLDAGANVECTPAMFVQFGQMGAVFAAERFGVGQPRVALLSNGEEAAKGRALVKDAHALFASGALGPDATFVGNVEGRDLMTGAADVVVTDGFTGNVALKVLEGGLRYVIETLLGILGSTPEARRAGEVLMPLLVPAAERLDPEGVGGAMLLGVDGVCVISHGSSSARAVLNAVRVAHELAAAGLVDRLRRAVASADQLRS